MVDMTMVSIAPEKFGQEVSVVLTRAEVQIIISAINDMIPESVSGLREAELLLKEFRTLKTLRLSTSHTR